MSFRKLTARQAEMLAELVASPDGRAVFPTRYNQDARTAYSLQRKGLCVVKFLKKAPGARYSYGYHGVELTRSLRTPPHQCAGCTWLQMTDDMRRIAADAAALAVRS